MSNVIPLDSESVTISKRQFRQICNAYINAVNASQQLLMVHRGDNPLSDRAVGRLEDGMRIIIQQLKEVVDGDTERGPSAS